MSFQEEVNNKKNKKVRLAVFDMDGTILDTLEDLQDSLNVTLERMGYPLRTYEEVRSFVGNGIRKLIERAVPYGTEKEKIEQTFSLFMEYYALHCADKTRPYEGITTLLKHLRDNGMLTAVVSNKAHQAVVDLCEEYFTGLFDVAVGEQEGMAKKPAPDSVWFVLEQLHIDKKDAVYIGDSEVDLATARNSGLEAVIVDWGFRDADFLRQQGAERMVSSADELEKVLLECNR